MFENIKTSDDFARYMRALATAYDQRDVDGLYEQDLADYLGGVGGAASGIDGIAKNRKIEGPGPIDWKWVARLMTMGFGHS